MSAQDFSKATPRPWFVVNVGTADEPMMSIKAARIAGKPPRHSVAICATGDSPQEMENANAALIVHAVNNHDALVEALRLLAGTAESGEHETAVPNDSPVTIQCQLGDLRRAWAALKSSVTQQGE